MIVLGTIVAVATGCNSSDLDDRVATLEAQVGELQSQIEEPTLVPIVVQIADASTTSCRPYRDEPMAIRWLIGGTEQGLCTDPDGECAIQAVIGERLPASCRD